MAELRFGIFSPQKSGYIFNSVDRQLQDKHSPEYSW